MADANTDAPHPIVLFGYESSPFTNKIRYALRMRRIPFTLIIVPTMMPRPVLISAFNLTYRKIPVMCIGKELYIDTSLILEAINSHPSYPPSESQPSLHPSPYHRTLTRLFSSHYTDRPLFRLTTGLIPQSVWSSPFGTDRASLIGHKIDASKLGQKIPLNLSSLDTYLSILEPLFSSSSSTPSSATKWILQTETPTAMDLNLYYQLEWGTQMSRGQGISDLTSGTTPDRQNDQPNIDSILNPSRYPGICAWFARFREHMTTVPAADFETVIPKTAHNDISHTLSILNSCDQKGPVPIMSTACEYDQTRKDLDESTGLVLGERVSVTPDDTGRNDPTLGTLVGIGTEEVVIVADLIAGRKPQVEGVRLHFPRVGFVVKPVRKGEKVRVLVDVKKAKL